MEAMNYIYVVMSFDDDDDDECCKTKLSKRSTILFDVRYFVLRCFTNIVYNLKRLNLYSTVENSV